MTKRTIKFSAFFLLFSLVIMAFNIPENQVPATVGQTAGACYMENSTFQEGEEITYKLYYNWNFVWLPAGEVVFKVNENDTEYHLSAYGRTYSSYEWFFKVRDYYDTYIDKETLLPNTSIRDVSEGGYKLYDKVTFDQENKTAVSLRGDTEDKTVRREFDTKECMHDILSIIYYSRNIDFNSFEAGENFPIKIFMDKEVWPLNVKYQGKDASKKIKGQGKFKTIRFSPEVISGDVFEEGTEMNVWVTDDNNRIPLLIESPVTVGSVKAVLKEYKGLRYDFTSKVD